VWFTAYGPADHYTTNELNQYTDRNSANAAYDFNGNMITGLDSSSYTYDAQNRLTSVYKNPTTETFKYDALNRQVSRTINGVASYNIWDGWNLIVNYNPANVWTNAYYDGPGGRLADMGHYYYSDGSGSTSHLADSTGHLLEWYRYDLHGTPVFYNAANTQIPNSAYGIRHLFTGQQWYSEIGLYDLRNRFYSPDIGRFVQSDPIRFWGDSTNLYRYCRNNPVTRHDPFGLDGQLKKAELGNSLSDMPTFEVVVTGTDPNTDLSTNGAHSGPDSLGSGGGPGGSGGPGDGGGPGGGGDHDHRDQPSSPDKTPPSTPSSTPPTSPSIMNPPTTPTSLPSQSPSPSNLTAAKQIGYQTMLVAGSEILLGLALETIPTGVTQVAGGLLINGGLLLGGFSVLGEFELWKEEHQHDE
jgi:RHS repeat-associated protein